MPVLVPLQSDPVAPGTLRLVRAKPNPAGGLEHLFVLLGDPVGQVIGQVENTGVLPTVTGSGGLRIFHFNDLHNHLSDLSGASRGTHRFAQMVKRVRDARCCAADDAAVLFLSIGDDHTGSVLDELLGWRADQFVLDASYRAYSHGGVDATVLGNHEFDRGAARLAQGIRQDADFPVLSANVHSSAHLTRGQDYFAAAIGVVAGLRIGMLGLTTHIETHTGQPDDPTFAVASPVTVLQNVLPALAPLVDVVLVMSHCGYGDGAHHSGKAAAARDIGEADFVIARAAAAITQKPLLVLGAHTHTRLNETGLDAGNCFDGVPVFQADCNGRYLGEIALNVTPASPTGYEISSVCLHAIKPHNDDIAANNPQSHSTQQAGDFDHDFERSCIQPMVDQVQSILKNEIARVTTEKLSFRHAVVARYAGDSALLHFMADAIHSRLTSAGFEVDFALINGATIQAGIEPGALSMGEWFDVMPYADEVFLVSMTGAELVDLLDNNAKRILRADEVQGTDCTGFLARGFVHASRHLRYRITPGATARQATATSIEVDGQPIAGLQDQRFVVAMPTYLALGAFGERWNGRSISGGVPGDLAGFDMRNFPAEPTNLVFRDEIAAFIVDAGTLDDACGSFTDGRMQLDIG